MRKLMWFTIGFGAVCGVCGYLWLTEGLLLPAVCLIAAALAGILLGRKISWLRIAGIVLLGAAVGLMWFQLFSARYISLAAELDEQYANVTARCTDYGYETEYGTGVEAVIYLEGIPFRTKLYVSGKIDMEPGDVLTGLFRFRVTTPDGTTVRTAQQGKGIFLLGDQEEDASLMKLTGTPLWAYPAIFRERLSALIGSFLPDREAGFARALVLGDRTGIDYETNTAFKLSGISHVIAVSGLHVTILFTLINLLCLKRRGLVALLGLPALGIFAAMAGFSPSVVRACIMQGLMILSSLFDREYDGPTELSFACLVMLICNPLVIVSISFQLSVGCMIGIFLFQKGIYEGLLERLGAGKGAKHLRTKKFFARSVSMTVSATILTTPLVAYYFGCVSLVSVITNLLVLWVLTLVFYGVMLLCLLGWLWPAAGAVLGKILVWPIRYILGCAKLLASFPLAAVYTRSIPIVIWLVFLYVLLGLFLLCRKRSVIALISAGVISLCAALAFSWSAGLTPDCRMTMLDVGQGQCILLQSEGKNYLVDCGGSDPEEAADLAADTLLSQGISRLDGLILTHYDRDHTGGVPYLLSRISADSIFAPESEEASGISAQLPGSVVRVRENIRLSFGGTDLTIFGPVIPDSSNESSLAVLLSAQNCDILITGDRSSFEERMLLKQMELPELEILVVGHHGAANATGEELLAAGKPKIAAISVGENACGHPAPEVLERLERFGCEIYRTDIHGNLVFRR